MARFFGSIQGNRGEATRLGSKQSGMDANVNGWDVGASIRAYVTDNNEDVIIIRPNGGSNARRKVPVTIGFHEYKVTVHTRDMDITILENGEVKVKEI